MRGIAAFEKREERKERFVKEINFRYIIVALTRAA